ncbi:hypothetical protein G7046_g3976 [Stylonectria norvegica]|nr:hypothetical protein G7046_g3976 [Stylonectria norvegica]
MSSNEVSENGWTAVPVDAGKIFQGKPFNDPKPVSLDSIVFPSHDPIVFKSQEYAKTHLPSQAYNHSMRVFYFSTIIAQQQFPELAAQLSPSTLALACLFHDIGTSEHNLTTTRMSFEFFGGILSMNVLGDFGSTKDQAEAVCETVIRHQDLGQEGTITFLGQIIQLATIYDNVGKHPFVDDYEQILHKTVREDVNAKFVRQGWLGCFGKVIRREKALKPWCHTTHIADFEHIVEGNELMKPYE